MHSFSKTSSLLASGFRGKEPPLLGRKVARKHDYDGQLTQAITRNYRHNLL